MANEYDDVEIPTRPLPKPTAKSVKDLISSMHKPSEMKVNVKVCIFGDKGTGKTVHIMKLMRAMTPPGQKIIYVDTAENFSTLQDWPELWDDEVCRHIQYENVEQLMILAAAIQNGSLPGVGGVVIDEYSSVVNMDKAWIVKARSQQAERENKFKDPFQPSQPDYLASQIRSTDVVAALMLCNVNLGFTGHEKFDAKKIEIRINMSPGAASDFERLVHGVYRATIKLENGQLVRSLQLQPMTNKVSVKNRIGGLGNTATMEEVIEAAKRWGNVPAKTDTTITTEEINQIQRDDELLSLLNEKED